MSPRLRKLLWTVFALSTTLVLAVVALISWLLLADLGVLKPHIETYVSEISGYELRIEGGLSIDVAEHSVLIAERVKLRHPGETGTEIASIGRLEVRLDLRSVVKGPIRIELLDVDNARIHLSAEMGVNAAADAPDSEQEDRGEGPAFLFKQAYIDDFILVYDDPDRDRPLELKIVSLRQEHRDDDVLRIDIDASFNGENLSLTGEVGTWDAILAGRDIHYNVDFDLDTLEVSSRGVIDNVLDVRRPTLEFVAHSPSIDDLTVLLGLGDEGNGSIDLTGTLQAEDDGPLRLAVSGNLGRTEILASGEFSDLKNLEEVDLILRASGPDLGRVFGLAGITLQQKAPFAISLQAHRSGPELTISEMTLGFGAATLAGSAMIPQFPSLKNSQISVRAEGPDIVRLRDLTGLKGGATGPFSMRLDTLTNATGDTLLEASLETSLARTTAKSEIWNDSGQPLSDIEFTIAGADLAAVVAAFASTEFVPAKPFDLAGNVRFANNGVDIDLLSGEIGSSSIRLDGRIPLSGGPAGIRLNVAAEGPALEELLQSLGPLDVRPGHYEIAAGLELQTDTLFINDLQLQRAGGEIGLNFELALPVSRRQAKVELSARGSDLHGVLQGTDHYETPGVSFAVELAGELDASDIRINELVVEVGTATLHAAGDIDVSKNAESTQFSFSANIPDLAEIGRWNGRALNSQAFSLQGDVVGNANELRIDNLTARLDDSDIAGSVLFQKGEVPNIVIEIHSDVLTYSPILAEAENTEDEPEPQFEDGKVVPDIAVPFEDLKKLNVSLDFEVEELQRDNLAMSDIRLQADLRDGVFAVENFGFRARAGGLVAQGRLDPADGGSATLQIVARGFSMGLSETNQDLAMTGDVDIKLEAKGSDLRALLGTANGMIFINTRGGRTLNNRLLHAMYGSLLDEILGTINPFKQSQKYTDYECIVLPMRFENGIATTLPSAFVSTDKIRLSLNPELNFTTEDILIDIRTIPRKTLGVSAGEFLNPYILVKGTMAAPRLAVDEQGVLISGGVAVATGGLSILARATWNRLSGGSDPCGKIAKKGQEELASWFPDIRIKDVADEQISQ